MFDSGALGFAPVNTGASRAGLALRRQHGSQELDSARREGHPVLPAGLHPLGRHRPHLLGQVDFAPGGADDFAGPGRRQNGEFQSTGAVPSCARSAAMNSAMSA